MTIKLNKPFAANGRVDEYDVLQMKKVLNRLGYYMPYEKVGITGIPDREVFDALKKFQRDHGLRVSGEARPVDETIKALSEKSATTPEGYYIWRTVEDNRVRANHAEYNGTVRAWSDSPDPGEDYNCRCWAETVTDPGKIYPDAINQTISPLDIAGIAIARGGLLITAKIIKTVKNLIKGEAKPNASQTKNLERFIKKIPANAKNNVKIAKMPNGDIKFTTVSPGKVPGSWARYEKTVNPEGKTTSYTKSTYDGKGTHVHTKNKF